jgi:hypothetical protein
MMKEFFLKAGASPAAGDLGVDHLPGHAKACVKKGHIRREPAAGLAHALGINP